MEPGMFFRMGAWERRTDMEIDPEDGLTAPVISRGDLIAAKLAAVRPQDLIDVAALRQTERQTAQMNAEEETGAEEIKKRRRREPE